MHLSVAIDPPVLLIYDHSMTAEVELEWKQRLAELSPEERRTVSAYLLRLKHGSSEGRSETSRLMNEMDSGTKTPLSQVR